MTSIALPEPAAAAVSLASHCATGPRAHLIGASGAGMQALADILFARGWQISGSDNDVSSAAWMRTRGARLFAKHEARAITGDETWVIHSDAVPPDNVERLRAARCGVPVSSYPQAVAELMTGRRGLSIAGTHGKSTTTAMIGTILEHAGLDPTVICGAAPRAGGHGGRAGNGPWVVAEACEYRANFRHQTPEIAVVLGIEPDHFDCYATPQSLLSAFEQFLRGAEPSGRAILNADCPRATSLRGACRGRVITFGHAATADWRATHVEHRFGRYRFAIERQGRPIGRVALRVPGRHQIYNALAAAAATHVAGASDRAILAALGRFGGLKRRIEHVGTCGGIDLIDDYAHHPTEVRATLSAVRQMFPRRRLWCVFEPHQVSRTAALLDEFAVSLQNADHVAVTDVFAAREPLGQSRHDVAALLRCRTRAAGADVLPDGDAQTIIENISTAARAGDVVVTLGAGEIWKRTYELADRLRTHRQAG